MSEAKALTGRTALVTGASKGIGAATAKALAQAGAHVILTARDVKGLEAVEDAIHDAGGTATIAPVDLTETDGIARLASALAGRWNALDILVLSAAYLPSLGPVTQIDGKEWSRAITVNLLASQALLASFDPLLKRASGGRVIGLTSSVAAKPRAYWGAYAATKAGFENILASYAQETGAISQVRVAIVDPGATRTQMRARAYPGEDPKSVKDPAVVADRLVAMLANDFENGHFERVDAN
jgi:NAD(P)-dependent dehydrogenase (short-subunit alcohol dehydrogenase family)